MTCCDFLKKHLWVLVMIVASFEMLISIQNKIWHAYSLFDEQKVQARKLLNERKGRALLMKKIVHPHLVDSRAEEGEGSNQESVPPLPAPPKGLSRPCQWKVVDAIGEQYEEAVSFFFFWGTLFKKKNLFEKAVSCAFLVSLEVARRVLE